MENKKKSMLLRANTHREREKKIYEKFLSINFPLSTFHHYQKKNLVFFSTQCQAKATTIIEALTIIKGHHIITQNVVESQTFELKNKNRMWNVSKFKSLVCMCVCVVNSRHIVVIVSFVSSPTNNTHI